MATVLLSRNLRSAVDQRIHDMRHAEMKSFTPRTPEQDLSPLVEALLWADHIELLRQIPHDWLLRAGQSVRMEITDLLGGREMQLIIHAENAKMPPTRSYIPYTKDVAMTKAELFDPKWDLFAGVSELRDAVKLAEEGMAIEAKWDGVRASITQLLNTARSLNEAVTALPALRLYLPDDIRAKLDAPVEKAPSKTKAARAARAAALVDGIDAATLAGAGVAGTLILGSSK